MSKKDSFEAFLADVLAAVPETSRATVEETFKLDAVRQEMERATLRQSDYSRNMDQLKADREALDQAIADTTTTHEQWSGWYTTASGEYDAMRQRIAELEAEGVDTVTTTTPGITEADLNARLADRDKMAIAFADALTDIKLEHREKFHEKLNAAALIDHAVKRGMTIDIAYRDLMAPRLDELNKADLDKQLQKAREDGAREALTKHRLPMTSGPIEGHPLDLAPKVQTNSSDRVSTAVNSWMNAQHTP
jgi:hypothetical protein